MTLTDISQFKELPQEPMHLFSGASVYAEAQFTRIYGHPPARAYRMGKLIFIATDGAEKVRQANRAPWT